MLIETYTDLIGRSRKRDLSTCEQCGRTYQKPRKTNKHCKRHIELCEVAGVKP